MKPIFYAPFVLLMFAGFNRMQAVEVEWYPQWNVGDQFTVELIKERTNDPKGNAAANKGRVLLNMSIQEKGEEFYIVHCTYGKFELVGVQIIDPLAVKMANISEGLCLKIKTDEDGTPQELTNIEEVIEHSQKAIDIMEMLLKENKLPQTTIDQGISAVRTMYKDPKTVEQMVLNEIALFLLFCGAKLELGSPSEFDESLPNPFQGEPLPGKGSILLKDFDKQTGIATIEYRLSVDKEKAAPILFAAMKKMMPQAPAPTKEEIPLLEFSDTTLYRIDTKKGWALSVEHSREIKANGQLGRVQRLSFKTLKDNK
jgi:hypothetical protein